MKKNIILFVTLLIQGYMISTMDHREPVPPVSLQRTYTIIPWKEETYFLPGESLQERNARLTALTKIKAEMESAKDSFDITHPFEGSPDLFAPKGTSPIPPRSAKQVTVELIAQAAANRKIEIKK